MDVTSITSVISLLGGLALFLYGMEVMGDGLRSFSASALKRALSKVTGNVIAAFFLGFLITCIIQSSTATIVLTVGLLGAGVLELHSSIGIVLGANVGTTITAQIIRLLDVNSSGGSWMNLCTPETLAPLGAIIGIILIKFVKKGSSKQLGTILMGFGILFTGLVNMTSAMNPLKESDAFRELIASLSSPLWGFLGGVLVTLLVQSSSASVGILQSLCSTGAMSFSLCFSYVLGAALGTGIVTAMICSIGAKPPAKRAVFVHVFYSVFGGALFMTVIMLLHRFGVLDGVWNRAMSSGDVANFETAFKGVVALLLLPFAGQLEKLACRVIPDRRAADEEDEQYAEIQENIQALDTHLFEVPSVALDQTAHVIGHMGELALKNYNRAVQLLTAYDETRRIRIEEREALIDHMADASNNYLVELSPHAQTDRDNERLNLLLRIYTEFERIGDLAVNIAEAAQHLHEEKITFSPQAMQELAVVTDAVRETVERAIACYNAPEDHLAARRVEPLEEVVDELQLVLKEHHIERLKAGECSVSAGISFLDILVNLERISDQCSNIAVGMLSIGNTEIKGNEHDYIARLHTGKDSLYAEEFRRSADRYMGQLRPQEAPSAPFPEPEPALSQPRV